MGCIRQKNGLRTLEYNFRVGSTSIVSSTHGWTILLCDRRQLSSQTLPFNGLIVYVNMSLLATVKSANWCWRAPRGLRRAAPRPLSRRNRNSIVFKSSDRCVRAAACRPPYFAYSADIYDVVGFDHLPRSADDPCPRVVEPDVQANSLRQFDYVVLVPIFWIRVLCCASMKI